MSALPEGLCEMKRFQFLQFGTGSKDYSNGPKQPDKVDPPVE